MKTAGFIFEMSCNQAPNSKTIRSGISVPTARSLSAKRFGQRLGRALLTSAIITAAVSNCAGDALRTEERVQKYPESYKAELLQFFHSYINDPTNIRDAAIADPALKPVTAIVTSGAGANTGGGSPGGGRGGGGQGGQFDGAGSKPFERSITRERYVVCVRYNAKDRDGRYTGVKQGMAIYAGGRLDGFDEQPRGACDQAEFKPFPELQKLSR